MSDYCTKCALEMFGAQCDPDIDVEKEFSELQPGFSTSGFICEGCGLIAISKTENGQMKVMRIKMNEEGENDVNNEWEDYER